WYPAFGGSFMLITLARICLSCAVLFVPTLLMGGTLPVLLVHFADRLATLGSRAGLLYGLNALGAALGSFLAGYALLELLGVAWTNAAAGLLNLAIGLLAWTLAHWGLEIGDWRLKRAAAKINPPSPIPNRQSSIPNPQSPSANPQSPILNPQSLVLGVFAVSGFVSMSYEVMWLRYLSFYFHETVYLYSGLITIFVLGIGIGSLLCGCLVARV